MMGDASDDLEYRTIMKEEFPEGIDTAFDRSPLIMFDESTHIYTVDGAVKRSVTQVLKGAGVIDYDGIDEYYLDRGTRAHDACTLQAQGWLNWSSIEGSDIEVYVKTFKSVTELLGLSYVDAGVPSYDPDWDICGTPDLFMDWDDSLTLVELKTGIAPMWLGLQLACYEKMTECDKVLGIELSTGKVYLKAGDFLKNTLTMDDIINGRFDLEKWRSNRKRRYMVTMK